jgi:UDP-2-acetamido-3-amino-2,3-dideoxy-glucuronate N-acetyltransferase
MISRQAEVSELAIVGEEVTIWEFSKIRENTLIGYRTKIGRNVYVGPGVKIGNDCKIQNDVLLYEPAIVEDQVFIGPGAIFTNDLNPRATNVSGTVKTETDWKKETLKLRRGASIGAGAICIAPIEIGEWAMVGAGAVVTRDVPSYALVVGNPARRIGWVGESGHRLANIGSGKWLCASSGAIYLETKIGDTPSELELIRVE